MDRALFVCMDHSRSNDQLSAGLVLKSKLKTVVSTVVISLYPGYGESGFYIID